MIYDIYDIYIYIYIYDIHMHVIYIMYVASRGAIPCASHADAVLHAEAVVPQRYTPCSICEGRPVTCQLWHRSALLGDW